MKAGSWSKQLITGQSLLYFCLTLPSLLTRNLKYIYIYPAKISYDSYICFKRLSQSEDVFQLNLSSFLMCDGSSHEMLATFLTFLRDPRLSHVPKLSVPKKSRWSLLSRVRIALKC